MVGGKLKGITLAGMSDKGEAAFIQKLNAETALLIKQEEKLQQTIAKGNAVKQAKVKLTQEEAVTQAALNNVSKLKSRVSLSGNLLHFKNLMHKYD